MKQKLVNDAIFTDAINMKNINASIVIRVFDDIFVPKNRFHGILFPSIARSCIASASLLSFLVILIMSQSGWEFTSLIQFTTLISLTFIFVNLFIDYCCLVKSRLLLNVLATSSGQVMILFVVMDIILSLAISFFLLWPAYHFIRLVASEIHILPYANYTYYFFASLRDIILLIFPALMSVWDQLWGERNFSVIFPGYADPGYHLSQLMLTITVGSTLLVSSWTAAYLIAQIVTRIVLSAFESIREPLHRYLDTSRRPFTLLGWYWSVLF